MKEPPVSVIIPVFNGDKTIAKTLESLNQQDYAGSIEIIVVDDGSKDNTNKIVTSYRGVQYFYKDNAGPAAARNRGAQVAASEYLFFTDSDCIPEKQWIKKMMQGWSGERIAVVAGSYDIANLESRLAYCIQREILYRHHVLMPEFPKSFGSYNFCVRRNIFNSSGGFNADYRYASGEDNDLSYKILAEGYQIHFMKDAVVKHFHPESLSKYLREQFRHGFWRAKMYYDHPAMMKGDDYTFWKDRWEVGLVCLCLFLFVLFLLWKIGIVLLLVLLGFFLVLELYFALLFTRHFFLGLYFAVIMFLRAWGRAFGFFLGLFAFSPRKITKKFK